MITLWITNVAVLVHILRNNFGGKEWGGDGGGQGHDHLDYGRGGAVLDIS